jgi:hypothetical protein
VDSILSCEAHVKTFYLLEGSKYGEYLEAWDLLRGKLPEVIGRIEACAEVEFFWQNG